MKGPLASPRRPWRASIVAALLAAYVVRWCQFDHRWNVLHRGQSPAEVQTIVGRPENDRPRAFISGAGPLKTVWEYPRGPYVYEAFFDADTNEVPTALYRASRRVRDEFEWLRLR
jgi:hypothetical protein